MVGGTNRNWALFLFLSIFWGTSYIGIKYTVEIWPPVFGAWIRVVMALVILVVLMVARHRSFKVRRQDLCLVWIAGLVSQGIPFAFLYWGGKSVSPGLSGILNGTVPLWTFILGVMVSSSGESFSWKKLIGISIGFFGLSVIFYPMLKAGNSHSSEMGGAIALIVMAMFYAVSNLMTRSILLTRQIDFWANLFHQTLSGTVTLFFLSLIFDPRWPSVTEFLSVQPLAATFYLAVVSSTLGWIFYFILIMEWGAVRASLVTYVVPLTAMFWDFVFFKTIPPQQEVWGIALIILGVALVQLDPVAAIKGYRLRVSRTDR